MRRHVAVAVTLAALVVLGVLLANLLPPAPKPVAPTPGSAASSARTCDIVPADEGQPDGLRFTPAALAAQESGSRDYLWGLIGGSPGHADEEWSAGIRAIVVSLSWCNYFPTETSVDEAYVAGRQRAFAALRERGFQLILSLGIHDTPVWLHANDEDSYFVNQFGTRYNEELVPDQGDANAVFDPTVRDLMARYVERVFADFHTDFVAVRLGGGRFGELTYPPAEYRDDFNSYWAYDANAQAASPVPGWKPGQPSPNGEARRFLDWYLQALTDYANWQVDTVRRHYPGQLMLLFPSWGIRPGQAEQALDTNLNGSTPAEGNGEVQRGYDFARQVAALSDPQVVVTTTWLDANTSGDGGGDARYWSPVKYLASLAASHPLKLEMYGENTGQGSAAQMELSANQMRAHNLIGMAWFNEAELFSGKYASVSDYQHVISQTGH